MWNDLKALFGGVVLVAFAIGVAIGAVIFGTDAGFVVGVMLGTALIAARFVKPGRSGLPPGSE